MLISRDADFDLYPYTPSGTAGWAFLVLFAAGGFVHLCMLIIYRSWFFIPFILGCAGEAAGYWARAQSHRNIREGGPYLIQLMLILASAPLLSATIYMALGRITRALDAVRHAFLSPRWTTKIYVVIDIGSFVCQMMGSAMQASGDPAGIKTGNTVVIAGLSIQLGAFGLFIINTIIFHRRLVASPTPVSMNGGWRRYLWMLYGVSLLVVVRSIFRLAEFVEGNEGHLYKTEVFLYIFDATLMFLVVIVMGVVHPGRLVKQMKKEDHIPLL
ncbi:putative RTA1 domain protein [Periconia macrospinosa]|uniref:Putative RTA1 domain protein n=1 Tax=Periconia macrospinosa TaxID=97972 RepID=A0A2V1E273_9PLEO|nr:putative RTA1 domain protein [Periconia macrospinosa]